MMKRKLLLIGVSVSIADWCCFSSCHVLELKLHEFFNAKGERVMYPYPLGTFKENPDLSIEGPQDQVSIGRLLKLKTVKNE